MTGSRIMVDHTSEHLETLSSIKVFADSENFSDGLDPGSNLCDGRKDELQ
jgi:hypothetical protein